MRFPAALAFALAIAPAALAQSAASGYAHSHHHQPVHPGPGPRPGSREKIRSARLHPQGRRLRPHRRRRPAKASPRRGHRRRTPRPGRRHRRRRRRRRRDLLKDIAIAPMLESVVGDVPHKIAIVGYDSSPVLVQDFTPDNDPAANGIARPHQGQQRRRRRRHPRLPRLLRRPPAQAAARIPPRHPAHQRIQRPRQQLTLDDALHAISDTNTAIYSIGFSTGAADFGTNAAQSSRRLNPRPRPRLHEPRPQRPQRQPQARTPPSRPSTASACSPRRCALATAAAIAAVEGLRKNIPETVARLTGGEYFKLRQREKSRARPRTPSPTTSPTATSSASSRSRPTPASTPSPSRLPAYSGVEVSARNGYWADTTAPPAPTPRITRWSCRTGVLRGQRSLRDAYWASRRCSRWSQ